jgi:hypothetical protein
MPAGRGYLAGPLSLNLTDHICQVQTTLGVPIGPIAYYIDWIRRRQSLALQEGDQLSDRGNTEHVDPCDQLRLSSLP